MSIILATAAGYGLNKPIIDLAQGIVSSYVDAEVLKAKYDISAKYPHVLPGVTDVFQAYIDGFMPELSFNWATAFHGIPIGVNPSNQFESVSKKLWQNVIDSKLPRLPIEQVISAYYQGLIDKDTFNKLMQNYGMNKSHIPVLQRILEPKFDTGVIFGTYLRGLTSEDKTRKAIRKYYGCNDKDADKILELTNVLPPVQDLIRFAVRDVFNQNAVDKQQLDAEYGDNKDLAEWASAQGLGQATIIDSNNNEVTRDILKDYWRAHWQLPAPGQIYQFLHRLRKGRIDNLKQQIPNLREFEQADADEYLRANDYTPQVRAWLEAISYNILEVRQLRQAYNEDVIQRSELVEQVKDRGYNDRDTNIIVGLYDAVKKETKDKEDEKERNKRWGSYRKQILQAYRDGSISASNANLALQNTGMDQLDVDAAIMAIDVEVNRKIVSAYINQTRAEYFLGGMDGITAYETLVQGGVAQLRAENLVSLWARQQTRKRKTANTDQLLQWYATGHIELTMLRDRLTTLGWQGVDVILLMAQANDKRSALIAKAQAQQARSDRQEAIDMKRVIDEQKRAAREAISMAMSQASPAKLAKWFKLGIITMEEVISYLKYYQYTDENIQHYVEEFLLSTGGKPNA